MPVTDDQELQELGRHAFGVAYRMIGSVAEAEDVVQEALLRLSGLDERPDEPAAWLTTVVTRLSIDHLRSARVRREQYVGPWLPDPLVTDPAADPQGHAELADTLSQAFLVVLERLTPLERGAFLLREVFDYDYPRVAAALDRSEAACRQLVARARRHLDAERARFDADAGDHERLLRRFVAAAEGGDIAALEELLAADAVLYSDGGGKAVAARKPIFGAERIARFLAGTARKRHEQGGFHVELVRVNGEPGRMLRHDEHGVVDVLSVTVAGGRITSLWIVRNPEKLAHL